MDRILKDARTSGSLNLSNRSLSEVPNEVYQSMDSLGEGEKWWEAVELQKLILAHNDIESIREDIRNLPMLAVLNVSHNNLSYLPTAIGELQNLKALDVSFNSIGNIPEEIGSAISLVKFDCSNNQLRDLPSSFGRCSVLADLKASNNKISSLPEELGYCTKLTKLDVEGNKLVMLPERLTASCTLLTEINASKNMLSSMPESIGSLSRLVRLDLHQNRISSIPGTIKGCVSLMEFYMGNNALCTLPTEIGELTKLGTFDLHSNQLKEYPVEACKLHLSVLDLSNNSLSGLPSELGLMTTLRKLLLVGNPLRSLRSSLVNGPTPALLKYLRSRLPTDEESSGSPAAKDVISMAARLSLTSRELSLSGMSFSHVPPEAWKSSEITKLDLSKNVIEELPTELSSCVCLEVLILSKNKINLWPGAILMPLRKLSCLKLDNNPLKQIPIDAFEATPKLQILDLSGNIGCLPEHPAFSSLTELRELYLRRTQLSLFPSEIMSLKHLKILDLSQNALQLIPEGLLEPSLKVLKVDGNPLRSIRRSILDRGTKGILAYLKEKIVD